MQSFIVLAFLVSELAGGQNNLLYPILPGLLNKLHTRGGYFTPLLIRLFLS